MPLPIKRLIQKTLYVLKKIVHGFFGFFNAPFNPGYIPTFLTQHEYDEKIIIPTHQYESKNLSFLEERLSKNPNPIHQDYLTLDDIVVYGNQGFIKKDRLFILDHLMHPIHIYAPQNSSILMWQNRWMIPKPKLVLEEAIVIVSLFSHNYYHYLLDTLAKFDQLKDKNDVLDIVMAMPKHSFQKDSLTFLNKKYRLHFVSLKTPIRVKKAWIPIAKYHPEFPPLKKIKYIRNLFQHETKVDSPKRVYLTRKTARNERKIVNEDAFIQCLKKYDFEVIDFTNQPLHYQHTVLRDTKIIISPHGAALTNIIFAESQTTIFELFHQNDPNTHYFNMASQLGFNYEYYVDETPSRLNRPNIRIDLKQFERQLEKLLKEVPI